MKLNQVTVPATDLAASVAFYRQLGLLLIVRNEHYARFELPAGEATFSLHLAEQVARGDAPVIYFECDVDAEFARLSALGVRFEAAPVDQPWLWREADLRDPAGNLLKLYAAGDARKHPPWRLPAAAGERALHVVIAGDALLLVRRAGADWRALQAEFPGYTTSLGPFDGHALMQAVEHEWPAVFAARAADIAAFAAGDGSQLAL
ncbi:MAG: VOC family protein [Myxococcales bacterium]|nr:VOC family protein [Myxococcales bacterium]